MLFPRSGELEFAGKTEVGLDPDGTKTESVFLLRATSGRGPEIETVDDPSGGG